MPLPAGRVFVRSPPTGPELAAQPRAAERHRRHRQRHRRAGQRFDERRGRRADRSSATRSAAASPTPNGALVRDCFVIVFGAGSRALDARHALPRVSRPGLDDLFHAKMPAGDYYAVAMTRRRSGRVDRSRVPDAGPRARDEVLDRGRRDEDGRPAAVAGAGVLKLRGTYETPARRALSHHWSAGRALHSAQTTFSTQAGQARRRRTTTATTRRRRPAPRRCAATCSPPTPASRCARRRSASSPSDIRENRLATTDADGSYEFKEVRGGTLHDLREQGQLRRPVVRPGSGRPTPPKPLQILDNQTVEALDLSLPRGSVITGRVVDEFGEPMSDVQIAPQRYQSIQGTAPPRAGRPPDARPTTWASSGCSAFRRASTT